MTRLASLALLPVLALSACAQAQPASPTAAAPAWPSPQQAAAGAEPVDAVASRLTVWLQLVGPNARSVPARSYADFLSTRPVWPRWHMLELRYDQALATEPDDATAAALCRERPPRLASALSRCVALVGSTPTLRSSARAEWREGGDGTDDAARLLALFGTIFTPEDHWYRFQREERSGHLAAAAHTAPLLTGERATEAAALLAFRQNAPDAETKLASVSASVASDPFLVMEHARWLRRVTRMDDALALWKDQGFAAERVVPAEERKVFWVERDTLARTLLAQGRATDALALADDRAVPDEALQRDAAFLTGWIFLQQLHEPSQAEDRFREVAASHALITRSRGYYWLGRARAATGDTGSAQADWQRAAELPETFYGQMAIAALAHDGNTLLSPREVPDALRIALRQWDTTARRNEHDPTASTVHVDGSDLARAAQILVSWNDRPHAREFLTLLLARDTDPADRDAIARLGARLGLPDIGVAVARRAARDGVSLPDLGWPRVFTPPPSSLPPGFAQALMRQESNFNPDATSASGAIGLMQLLPGTARDMARAAGMGSVSIAALHDPDTNMRLGTTYLEHISQKFEGVVPYAAAGYNAGPHRVSQWLAGGDDPSPAPADQDAVIDWIEMIPYAETRSYVQRVWESIAVFATRDRG